METELLPCPFCGGEAAVEHVRYSHDKIVVRCLECRAETDWSRDERQAIEAWNTRAERTCEVVYDEHGCPECGECGCVLYSTSGYCPNCGVKVVEHD